MSVDQLIKHGVAAMKASAQDTDLTEHNLSIGVCGKDYPFKLLSKTELKHYLSGEGDVEMI